MKRQQALLVRKTLLVRKADRPALEHEFNLEQMTLSLNLGFPILEVVILMLAM